MNTFHFLLIPVFVFGMNAYGQDAVDGITYSSYNNAKNTYNYTYWDYNFRTSGVAPRKFTNQTSSYNLSINYNELSIASLNVNSNNTSPSAAFTESNESTFPSIQPGNIDYKILKNGLVLHEKPSSSPTRSGTKISQMVEYGTWCTRRVIDSLRYTGNPSVYGSYSGIEFTSWHNRFRICFHLKPRTSISNGQLQLSVEMPEAYSNVLYSGGVFGFSTSDTGEGFAILGGVTAESVTICGNTITVTTAAATLSANGSYEVSLIFHPVKDNFCATYTRVVDDAEDISITTEQTLPDKTNNAKVTYVDDEGVFYVDIPSYRMGYNDGGSIDLLQNIKLHLTNNQDKDKSVRLCFREKSPKNVVGFSSMLRNTNGDPSGLPLQISKNWHKSTPMLYSTAWVKEYTEVVVPANTILNFDYTRVGARWGNVYGAFSHQLCVVGAGVPRGGWLEAGLGSFGESITHSPDYEYGGAIVCDYRPFLVTNQYLGLTSKEYGWTGNLGGMDLLVYIDEEGKRVEHEQVKTRFKKYGPNLTETSISAYSSDKALKLDYTFQLNRSDDFLRIYYKIKVKALKDTPFDRFHLFQLGSDQYHLLKAQSIAYGDSSGVRGAFIPNNSDITDYTTEQIPLTGSTPWIWAGEGVAANGYTGIDIDGNNSLIIRSYNASFGGVPDNTPYFRERVSSTGYGAQNPTSYCIVPPKGIAGFAEGDSMEIIVETCLLPGSDAAYYGPNTNFKNALTNYGDSWEVLFREVIGNDLMASSASNKVNLNYPPTVEAIDNNASVTITGGKGYVPLVFTNLTNISNPKLWLEKDGSRTLIDQSNYGNDFWQAEYDNETGLYDLIYNVNHDTENDSIGTFTYYLETPSSPGPNSEVWPEEDTLSECPPFETPPTNCSSPEPEPDLINLRFGISDEETGQKLSGVSVRLDSLKLFSGPTGAVLFETDSGSHTYTITNPGYFPVDSSLNLISDTLVDITITKSQANLKFRILSDEVPVNKAIVSIGEEQELTGYVGVCLFQDLPRFQQYSYTVSKEGYYETSSQLLLVSDSVITINLNKDNTSVKDWEHNGLRLYPNPAGSSVSVESDREIQEITIYSVYGRQLSRNLIQTQLCHIDVSSLNQGVYFLNIKWSGGSAAIRRVVISR